MDRTPEPETVMEALDSVNAFHAAGLPGGPLYPIYLFNCQRLSRLLPHGALVVDLACGPAHFLSYLLSGRSDVKAIGIDLSEPMLGAATKHLTEQGVIDRAELVCGDVVDVTSFVPHPVSAVVCMSALHQVQDQAGLAEILGAIRALQVRDACAVWLFDLVRPPDEKTIELIPRAYEMSSGKACSAAFKQDWVNSLRAGWTFEELSGELQKHGPVVQGIEANNSQLHFAASKDRSFTTVEWHGDLLDPKAQTHLRSLARALDAANI